MRRAMAIRPLDSFLLDRSVADLSPENSNILSLPPAPAGLLVHILQMILAICAYPSL